MNHFVAIVTSTYARIKGYELFTGRDLIPSLSESAYKRAADWYQSAGGSASTEATPDCFSSLATYHL